LRAFLDLTPLPRQGYSSPPHTRRTSEEGRVWKTPIFKVCRRACISRKWVALLAKAILQTSAQSYLENSTTCNKVNAKDFFKKSKALIDVVNFNLLKLIISFLFYKYL
jgi:hypothetical protein